MHRRAWLGVAALNAMVAVSGGPRRNLRLVRPPPGRCQPAARRRRELPTRHALAILGLAALGWPRDHVAWLFFYGILLFSGSLYMRALSTGQAALVLGALSALLLLGWFALAWSPLISSRA